MGEPTDGNMTPAHAFTGGGVWVRNHAQGRFALIFLNQ